MKDLQYNGHSIQYHEAGEGRPLLFLHNAGNDHHIWDYQLSHFAPHYRVVAPDSLGYGLSDSPSIDYGLPLYIEMVSSIIEQLDLQPVTIIGNCIGASMALGYALNNPQAVRSLILFNVATTVTVRGGKIEPGYRLLSGRRQLASIAGDAVEIVMSLRPVSDRVLRGQYGDVPPEDPQFQQHIRNLYKTKGKMSSYISLLCNWNTLDVLDKATFQESFPPMHILWGTSPSFLQPVGGCFVSTAAQRQ